MPDHVHFILFVQERLTDCTLGDVIRGFKQGCNKALRAALAAQERAERGHVQPQALFSRDMGAEKNDEQATTTLCSTSQPEGIPRPHFSPSPPLANGYRQPPLPIRSPRMLAQHSLFEEDFDETILRHHGQLRTMINYVHNNPKHRWQKQRHPDLLIPIRGIIIAGRSYDAIGNVNLLSLSRQQVWVRSRWDEMTRRQYQNDCLIKARHFHALVSPFINPHEAAVRNVALQEGHSVIVLTDNGFTDFTQCPGNLYDYCLKGQVLVLVPSEFPHVSNKHSITRQECMILNNRAEEISNES